MPSSFIFGLFLTLIGLTAGRSLPLIDGITDDTLWNSTGELMWNAPEETLYNPSEWEKLANETDLFPAEINAQERWALTFTVVISNIIEEHIWEPYLDAFAAAELKTFNGIIDAFDAETTALLNKKSFNELLSSIVRRDVDKEINHEIDIIGTATADIVADFPNWLDTEALEKVDITKLAHNSKSVLDAMLSNSKVPEQQTKQIHELLLSIKSLSARVERIATDAAIYTVKLHKYLLETYPESAPYFLSERYGTAV